MHTKERTSDYLCTNYCVFAGVLLLFTYVYFTYFNFTVLAKVTQNLKLCGNNFVQAFRLFKSSARLIFYIKTINIYLTVLLRTLIRIPTACLHQSHTTNDEHEHAASPDRDINIKTYNINVKRCMVFFTSFWH